MAKKLHIKTYGCQMNVYDSYKMADIMAPLGYELSDDYAGADMVILNTCHIREKASEKVYSELGRIRQEKERLKATHEKEMLIAVAGCVAQAEGEEIMKRAPFVDMVMGPQTFHQLPELITKTLRKAGRTVELDFKADEKFDSLPQSVTGQGTSAFLAVQEGCDKFCTFCVVPYTRGAEYSRPWQQVVDEAKQLRDRGAVEINLLGQNVNAYHGGITLAELIAKISDIPEIKRIRYTTSHPRDIGDDLIAAHGEFEKLMPFLHLPVQSGSNKVLKEMNRKHERDFYFDIIERLRKARHDLAFSSDFIVGFPGESEQDFEDTMDLVRRVNYAQCYSFKYSPRPGTPGSTRGDQVAEEAKAERLAALQALINEQQMEYNRSFIGKEVEVLLDRKGRYESQFIGKTPYMHSVHLTTRMDNFGNLVKVRIKDALSNSLAGEIIENDAPTSEIAA